LPQVRAKTSAALAQATPHLLVGHSIPGRSNLKRGRCSGLLGWLLVSVARAEEGVDGGPRLLGGDLARERRIRGERVRILCDRKLHPVFANLFLMLLECESLLPRSLLRAIALGVGVFLLLLRLSQPHRFVLHGHRAFRAARTGALRMKGSRSLSLGQPHQGRSLPFGCQVPHGCCIRLLLSQHHFWRLGVYYFDWPVLAGSHRLAKLTRCSTLLLLLLLLLPLCGRSASFR